MRASNLTPRPVWIRYAILAIATLTLGMSAARADDNELSRLKSALRDSISALRDAQDENAALTAKQTELTAQLAAAQQQIDRLKAQAGTASGTADQLKAAQAETQQAQSQLDQTQAVLKKWEDGYNNAASVARARDAAARDYQARYAQSAGEVTQCTRMNDALEKLGQDMLDKVGRCSFGDFMAAHEPITQIYRARLESLKGGYGDKLRDNKFPPE